MSRKKDSGELGGLGGGKSRQLGSTLENPSAELSEPQLSSKFLAKLGSRKGGE